MIPVKDFQPIQLQINTQINKQVSVDRKSWTDAEKKSITKQEQWNVDNRER
jgi:hypothetical protein